MNLKPCPCGKIPDKLHISDAGQGGKWANATGNCCGEWTIEFRTGYHSLDSEKCMKFAIEDWNNAPRQIQPEDSADFCQCKDGASVQHLEDTHCMKCDKIIDRSY